MICHALIPGNGDKKNGSIVKVDGRTSIISPGALPGIGWEK
jgi:hypothetical protein